MTGTRFFSQITNKGWSSAIETGSKREVHSDLITVDYRSTRCLLTEAVENEFIIIAKRPLNH
jgi:hypothetical protein